MATSQSIKKLLLTILFTIILGGCAYAEWTVQTKNDDFTNTKSIYLITDVAYPNQKLSFPYENTQSNLVVMCYENDSDIYFFFNSVNLNIDGYDSQGDAQGEISVKVGDKIFGMDIFFQTGSNFINLSNMEKKRMLRYIGENDTIMVRFDHHSDGLRHYKYNTSNFNSVFKENCLKLWDQN